jgi:hypothetical protein
MSKTQNLQRLLVAFFLAFPNATFTLGLPRFLWMIFFFFFGHGFFEADFIFACLAWRAFTALVPDVPCCIPWSVLID